MNKNFTGRCFLLATMFISAMALSGEPTVKTPEAKIAELDKIMKGLGLPHAGAKLITLKKNIPLGPTALLLGKTKDKQVQCYIYPRAAFRASATGRLDGLTYDEVQKGIELLTLTDQRERGVPFSYEVKRQDESANYPYFGYVTFAAGSSDWTTGIYDSADLGLAKMLVFQAYTNAVVYMIRIQCSKTNPSVPSDRIAAIDYKEIASVVSEWMTLPNF